MESEKIINKNINYSLNVAASKINSLRITEQNETVIRVYDNGFIGIAGAKGKADENDLFAKAKEALNSGVQYPEMLDENKKRTEDVTKVIVKPEEFVGKFKRLISRLSKTYPDFIFSNKINMDTSFASYENSKNTSYSYAYNSLDISLCIKDKASANIMDAFYGASIKNVDEDGIVEDVGRLYKAYYNKLPMPDEDLPIIIDFSTTSYIARHIVADLYMQGASLFAGKLGEKIFSDKLNICVDHTPGNKRGAPFFDCEGATIQGDKFYFIKNGVFTNLVTCKRSAKRYNLPVSGCGYSDFTSVPSFGLVGYNTDLDEKPLSKIAGGRAIYIADTSGGDMTADGTLGLPILLAFLYEDGKLIGRLPEFSIGGSIFDVLGKNLMGVCKTDFYTQDNDNVIVSRFNINR